MNHRILSRFLISGALLGASTITFAGVASSGAPLQTVRVLIQAGNLQDIPLFVAKTEGFEAKAGLNIDLIVSTQPLTPLLSDSADISLITGSLAITGAQAGYAIKVAGVMTDAQWSYTVASDKISVPAHSWPATFEALKGTIAGTTVLGGGEDQEFRAAMLLAGAGNDFQDESLGTAGAEEVGVDAGTVDSVTIPQPVYYAATLPGAGAKQVFNFVTDAAPAALKAPSNVVVVAAPFAVSDNSTVKAFMGMLVQTEAFMKQKKNFAKVEAIAETSILPGASKAELASTLSAIPYLYNSVCWTQGDFNDAHTLLKDIGLLTTPVSYSQLLDTGGQEKGC
jgi:ABC-type nitrate/sulfonate/bicarbonate transport system substrate-binding protein